MGDERRSGWLAASAESGVADATLQAYSLQDAKAAAIAVAPLVERLGVGGAVVCASDTLALGVYTVLHDRQLAVGMDFGLLGFDDTDIAQALGISSVRQPLTAIAAAVLDMAMAAGNGKAGRGPGLVLDPAVVARSSSQRAPVHSVPSQE